MIFSKSYNYTPTKKSAVLKNGGFFCSMIESYQDSPVLFTDLTDLLNIRFGVPSCLKQQVIMVLMTIHP